MVLYIVTLAYQDLLLGGNPWKQGDWLINNSNIIIRRGILGSVILKISQGTLISPVAVVVALQIALVIGSTILISLAIKLHACRGTLWILVLSPGFFISFWSLDTQGGLRKELIVFFAFSTIFYAVTRLKLRKSLVYGSALVYVVAVLAHEGNIFFLPFLIFCYFKIFTSNKITKTDLYVVVSIVLFGCVTTIITALYFNYIENYLIVCQPLLEAGLRNNLCEGAIKALELGINDFLKVTVWIFLSPRIFAFILIYGFTSLTILIIGSYLFDRRTVIRYYLISAFFFLPLYIVAVDWGRWVSFHSTAVIFTMLIVLSLEDHPYTRKVEMARAPFLALLIFSVLWGFSHYIDMLWGGISLKLINGLFPNLALSAI